MKQIFNAIIWISLVFTSPSFASESLKEISVKEVQAYVLAKPANVAILDANNEDARKSAGTVPGAILLTSYDKYALTELPKDKDTLLVFYCYNSYCQASHAAAERAEVAGYKNVGIMKAGIDGWNKAK